MVIDTVSADSLEVGDAIIVKGDHITITHIDDGADRIIDIRGFSEDSGDEVEYCLFFDEYVDIWSGIDE